MWPTSAGSLGNVPVSEIFIRVVRENRCCPEWLADDNVHFAARLPPNRNPRLHSPSASAL